MHKLVVGALVVLCGATACGIGGPTPDSTPSVTATSVAVYPEQGYVSNVVQPINGPAACAPGAKRTVLTPDGTVSVDLTTFTLKLLNNGGATVIMGGAEMPFTAFIVNGETPAARPASTSMVFDFLAGNFGGKIKTIMLCGGSR